MEYDVLDEVNRDQTMFFVVHVGYDVLSKVILDKTLFYVVQVYVLSEVNRDQLDGDLLGSPRGIRRPLRSHS